MCQLYGSAGQSTAYQQQASLLRQKGQLQPNPRKQFILDLGRLVKSYHDLKCDIILMGDFNEVIGLKQDGMASVISTGHLTDVQAHLHSLDGEQSTYSRGPNRVDYSTQGF